MEIEETERGLQTQLILKLPKGLHARPSAKVAQTANKYEADIHIMCANGEVNAKSMLDVLSLSCPYRARLTIIARGVDAREAISDLYDILTAACS